MLSFGSNDALAFPPLLSPWPLALGPCLGRRHQPGRRRSKSSLIRPKASEANSGVVVNVAWSLDLRVTTMYGRLLFDVREKKSYDVKRREGGREGREEGAPT